MTSGLPVFLKELKKPLLPAAAPERRPIGNEFASNVEQGNDILVGGVDVRSQLMELGLIDEYRFCRYANCCWRRQTIDGDVSLPERLQLKLVESKNFFKSGCVALRYLKQ